MFDRQSILVTGASSGIGEACVRHLVAQRAHVAALDLCGDKLAAVFGDEANVARVAGDVSRLEDCVSAVELAASRTGQLNGVIHCAAVHSSTAWDSLKWDELQRVLSVNVGGSFLIAQTAGRYMMTHGGGAILLTSSSNVLAGGVGGEAGTGGPAYVASKSAIVGLVRSLARSLGPHGVTVNGIMPGVTDTPMTADYSKEHRISQALRTPLGRIAAPAEIAEVSCFLISKGARYMTGETSS